MNIEAVTVCVNYADFLAETLPWNMQHFSKIVVVTSFDDKETLELCRKLSVECRPTDVMYMDGDKFNKGRAVDFGIGYLRGTDWMCHIDADTWLPPMTRNHLEKAHLDPEFIYGIDRCLCPDYDAWKSFISGSPAHQHDYNCRVKMPPFPIADRISLIEHSGYIPIGYFQLWHGKHNRRYPLHHHTAERSDVLFPLQWPSKNRAIIGEVVGIHLESELSELGANWSGRTTKRFERHHHETPAQEAAEHKHYCK